jgi:hypothetical protein
VPFDDELFLLNIGVGIFEVEAVHHFPLGLIYGITEFLAVYF